MVVAPAGSLERIPGRTVVGARVPQEVFQSAMYQCVFYAEMHVNDGSQRIWPSSSEPESPFPLANGEKLNSNILGGLAALTLNQSFSRMAISPEAKRKSLATVIISLITWFAARMILGHSRIVAPARLIPLSFFALYSSVALALKFSPIFRQAALSIPQDKLIGLHIVRVGGFVFLALRDMRLLPAQFAVPAGYGDIIVAMAAPLVVYALNKNKPFGRELAIAWNFLGLLDFAIALVTGMVFIGPYVRQLVLTGHSIAYLDYVLMIPGFGVPILMLTHINSLFNLRTMKGVERNLTTSSI